MRKVLATAMVCSLVLSVATSVEAQRGQGRGNLTPEQQAARQAEQARRLAEELKAPRPIAALDSIWIEELTWMEVRDAMAAGKITALIPTGGVEQNGPYLATGKHNYVLRGACERIARKLGDALCAPIVAFVPEGNHSPPSGHMRYPGTISLRQETYEMMLGDIGQSLKAHGFEHIIFFGDSGGNQRGMENTVNSLNEAWDETIAYYIPEFYRYREVTEWMGTELGIVQPTNDGIHDDYVITSLMMITDPTSVRYDQRVAAGKATINGLSIDPKEKTIEIGNKLMDFRADQTVKAIKAALVNDTSNEP